MIEVVSEGRVHLGRCQVRQRLQDLVNGKSQLIIRGN